MGWFLIHWFVDLLIFLIVSIFIIWLKVWFLIESSVLINLTVKTILNKTCPILSLVDKLSLSLKWFLLGLIFKMSKDKKDNNLLFSIVKWNKIDSIKPDRQSTELVHKIRLILQLDFCLLISFHLSDFSCWPVPRWNFYFQGVWIEINIFGHLVSRWYLVFLY